MTTVAETTSFLTFSLAGGGFALPLDQVREIVTCRAVVRVPSSGDSLRGVMNLRGNVVPVIDLSRHLGFAETRLSDNTCALLLDTQIDGENSAVGGLVEEIRAVVDVPPGDLASVPGFGTPIDPQLIRGLMRQGDRVTYILNLDAILEALL